MAAHRCTSLDVLPLRGEARQGAPPSPLLFGGKASPPPPTPVVAAAMDASPWELLQGLEPSGAASASAAQEEEGEG
jgi:hypothetical protein